MAERGGGSGGGVRLKRVGGERERDRQRQTECVRERATNELTYRHQTVTQTHGHRFQTLSLKGPRSTVLSCLNIRVSNT